MLPFFESKQEKVFFSCPEQMSFPAHLHHHVEILYITQGEMEIEIGTQRQTLTPGSLAVVFPGKVHAYHTPTASQSIMVIIPSSFAGPLKPLLQDMQPACPFLHAQAVPAQLVENLQEITQAPADALLQALAHLVLARMIGRVSLVARAGYDSDTLLCSAIAAITRSYRENIQLCTIASQLGVTECHLSRTLCAGTGMRFREYINSLRIADAQYLLANTERSVLDIAMECGFQNLRTFNRAFAENMQCTPREYRKQFTKPLCALG